MTAKEDSIDVFAELVKMYYELLEFKEKKPFIFYGFAVGGPHNKWLKDVHDLRKHDTVSMVTIEVSFGSLEQLGFLYVVSNGKESEVSKRFNKKFKKAIALKNQK